MITFGTFNIYFFGAADEPGRFRHAPTDDPRLAALVSRLEADVIGFIEIVDIPRFERLLALLGPGWTVRDAAGAAVASHVDDSTQKLVLAWNMERVAVVAWTRIPAAASHERSPVVARVKVGATEVLAVLVHAKSTEFDNADGIDSRKHTFASIAAWLAAPPPEFTGVPAIVLGDFNSTKGSPEQDALLGPTGLAIPDPITEPASAGVWTSNFDGVVTDHFAVSPALSAVMSGPPVIVAFDQDPSIDDPGGSVSPVLKRLSDHRPVWLRFELG